MVVCMYMSKCMYNGIYIYVCGEGGLRSEKIWGVTVDRRHKRLAHRVGKARALSFSKECPSLLACESKVFCSLRQQRADVTREARWTDIVQTWNSTKLVGLVWVAEVLVMIVFPLVACMYVMFFIVHLLVNISACHQVACSSSCLLSAVLFSSVSSVRAWRVLNNDNITLSSWFSVSTFAAREEQIKDIIIRWLCCTRCTVIQLLKNKKGPFACFWRLFVLVLNAGCALYELVQDLM